VIAASAPDLLSLLPGVGPVLRAGAVVAKAAFDVDAGSDPQPGIIAGMVRQAVCDAVLQIPERVGPLVVAIDDAHRIDASSCAVIRSLAPVLDSRSLSLVLAYRPEEVGRDHPLGELLDDLELSDGLVRVELAGFSPQVVSMYVAERVPGAVPGLATGWLAEVTGGTPFFLEQYLRLLEERTTLDMLRSSSYGTVAELIRKLAQGPDDIGLVVPPSVEMVLRERTKAIDEQTKRLLSIGATQGERFMSAVIEQVARVPRMEVLDRLYRVHQEFGVIRPTAGPRWVADTESDFYVFDHGLLRQSFYDLQSPQAKRDMHAAVGEVLERLSATVPGIPQEFALDIAHHLHLGRRMVSAARHTLTVAQDLAMRSSSFAEASRLARRALDDIHAVRPTTPEADRLRLEAIELLLVVTELRWRGRPELQQRAGLVLPDLAAEASAAAERIGDVGLRARALFMEGKILLRTSGPNAALPKLRAAAELAGTGQDAVILFITTAEYGHHLAKQDLRAGLALLRSAEKIYDQHPQLRAADNPTVAHILDEAQLQIGINSFDVGDFDEALRRIHACVTSLRSRSRNAELAGALNYRAQVEIALGKLEEAIATLREAIAIENVSEEDKTGWYGWNLGLLARTLVQVGTLDEARGLAEGAWADAQRLWLANIVPIVRIYHAEVDLASTEAAAARRAEQMLQAALQEARIGGLPRSEVNALSLLSKLRLREGNVVEAVSYGDWAVELLDRSGPLSTVCSEEIFYRHSQTLRASGDFERARGLLRRSWVEVERKAASLSDPAMRRGFLQGVALNQEIVRSLPAGSSRCAGQGPPNIGEQDSL
jgi:tetratricopeptide (TPR) repeat protein